MSAINFWPADDTLRILLCTHHICNSSPDLHHFFQLHVPLIQLHRDLGSSSSATTFENVLLRLPIPSEPTSRICCPEQSQLLPIFLSSTTTGIRPLDALPSIWRQRTIICIRWCISCKLWLRIVPGAAWCKRSDGHGAGRSEDGVACGVWNGGLRWGASVTGRARCELRTHTDEGMAAGVDDKMAEMLTGQTLSVLNPMARIDQHIMDDADLAGPFLFCALFGTFLLLVSNTPATAL